MVNIETATVLTMLGFVLGFFSNILAMKRMFVSKAEFSDFKEARTRVWVDHEKTKLEFRDHMEQMCETRRQGCAPLRTSLEAIEKDVNELFKLMRVTHGRLERVIGKLENNANCYWPQEREE